MCIRDRYPGINSVTAITEKDDGHMWIGTSAGLYLLDKESGRFQYVCLLYTSVLPPRAFTGQSAIPSPNIMMCFIFLYYDLD